MNVPHVLRLSFLLLTASWLTYFSCHLVLSCAGPKVTTKGLQQHWRMKPARIVRILRCQFLQRKHKVNICASCVDLGVCQDTWKSHCVHYTNTSVFSCIKTLMSVSQYFRYLCDFTGNMHPETFTRRGETCHVRVWNSKGLTYANVRIWACSCLAW